MSTVPGGLGRGRGLLTRGVGAPPVPPAPPPGLRRAVRVALLAVDEAHCIVEWGNEFRPVYRRLGQYRYLLGNPRTLALTASATPAARREILDVLRLHDAEVVVTSFDRPNLDFVVRRVRDDRERFARIRGVLREPLAVVTRSEEHTSELQSLAYLVCRLLLEKKN